MKEDEKVLVGLTEDGTKVSLLPKMANRHGLIAGATGTGKTVTLRVLAESFSELGVPVFISDVKGDLAGLAKPGEKTKDMAERMERFHLSDESFPFTGFPVTFWDVYGKRGIPLRTTISEMGPLLLSRILELNELQSDILTVAFRIADEHQLLLFDTKDLKALLNYISENRAAFEPDYGKMAPQSIAAILRAVVALEAEGGDIFFGEPALSITDFFQRNADGKGMINILSSESLINNSRLYSMFLLWLLAELFEKLPEVGDLDLPKMVFFFDEAHLLFRDAPKVLVEKIEQVVRLVRSKGVGVYFCTQNPGDLPDMVLGQLGNRIEHALHAYTPADQKAVKAVAESFRVNPAFNTYDMIQNLGVGEAVVSFLSEDGVPGVAQKIFVLPPQSRFGTISDADRDQLIRENFLYTRYANPVDNPSAYEFLQRQGLEKQSQKEKEEEDKKAEKEEQKAKEKEQRAYKNAAKSVASSAAGTIGRQVGKTFGSSFGSFGKTLGGNLGASIGRGIIGTLFGKK